MSLDIDFLDKAMVYYIASPYSPLEKDHETFKQQCKKLRYEMVDDIAAFLFTRNFILLEPIASCHHKSEKYPKELSSGYEYWMIRDRKMIDLSDAVLVLNMTGWKKSVGVTDEIRYAKSRDKPVYLVSVTGNQSGGHMLQSYAWDELFNLTSFNDLYTNKHKLFVEEI